MLANRGYCLRLRRQFAAACAARLTKFNLSVERAWTALRQEMFLEFREKLLVPPPRYHTIGWATLSTAQPWFTLVLADSIRLSYPELIVMPLG